MTRRDRGDDRDVRHGRRRAPDGGRDVARE
jgi:hypothetical protein